MQYLKYSLLVSLMILLSNGSTLLAAAKKAPKGKYETVVYEGKIESETEENEKKKKITTYTLSTDKDSLVIPKSSVSKVKRFNGKNVKMKAKVRKSDDDTSVLVKVLDVKEVKQKK